MSVPRLHSIDALLHRLLLGDREVALAGFPPDLLEYAEARVSRVLGLATERAGISRVELRLRLALHLAPATAIAYEPANPIPRHRLIESFILEHFGLGRDEALELARDVAKTLSVWDEERESVTGHIQRLLERQEGRCAHCGMEFGKIPWTLATKDSYKPYHEAPEELLRPEVDHIEAISLLGTNDPKNLQALCRLCNFGKGDGLGINVREELEQARMPEPSLTRHYRIRMFYSTVLRDGSVCVSCRKRSKNSELTIRLRHSNGSFVRSNLHTVCVNCAGHLQDIRSAVA